MPAGADDGETREPEATTALVEPEGLPSERADPGHHEHHHHHVLIEPEEDRWRWRRKIRQDPRKLAVYRVGVAIAGLLFIALGAVTGPLPGPGGIPLVLLGLAIWSSEFEWAHKVMVWFKAQVHRFRGWSRRKQALFWIVFFSCCGLCGYLYLLILGIPAWMPKSLTGALHQLPGV